MVAHRGIGCVLCLLAAALATPAPVADEAFEVATIKLTPAEWAGGRFFRMQTANQLVARGYAIRVLISAAYDLNPKAVSGGPAWIDSDRYDILAKTPGENRPSLAQQKAMLRRLLADRFDFAFHREKREMSVFALRTVKTGSKLKESVKTPESHALHPEGPPPLVFVLAPDVVRVPGREATTAELAQILQRAALDRPVVDETGLTARYDFDLEFAPDASLFGGALGDARDGPRPGLFAAIQEQLGLKLEAVRGMVDVIVIDRIGRPSEN